MTSHQQLQQKTIKTLSIAQIGAGVGTAGTVAAGSLLVAEITDSETLAGLAQTASVLGAAALALPLARLTSRGGRRVARWSRNQLFELWMAMRNRFNSSNNFASDFYEGKEFIWCN